MPTVQEMLKQTGFTDQQIAAMDAKAIGVFSTALSTAEDAARKAEEARVQAQQAREAAELERRSNVDFYETKVMPGLLGFEEEKKALETARINAESRAVFYESQVKGLKESGFLPQDAPAFVVPGQQAAPPANVVRDAQGRYVPGATGSPIFDPNQIAGRIGDVAGTISDIQWKYQTLYNKPLPIPPSQLIAQADAQKLSPMDYAARTFGFQQRELEISEAAKREHDTKVAADAVAAKETEWKAELEKVRSEAEAERKKMAERASGSNPEVRVAVSSQMPEIARATKANERPDPLKMTDAQRRAFTRQQIHKDVETNAQVA